MKNLNSLLEVKEILKAEGFNASISEIGNGGSAVFVDFGINRDDVQIITARELSESKHPVTPNEVIFYANREA